MTNKISFVETRKKCGKTLSGVQEDVLQIIENNVNIFDTYMKTLKT